MNFHKKQSNIEENRYLHFRCVSGKVDLIDIRRNF